MTDTPVWWRLGEPKPKGKNMRQWHIANTETSVWCGAEQAWMGTWDETTTEPPAVCICTHCRRAAESGVSGSEMRARYVASTEFLLSYEWRKVRMEAIKRYGNVCMCCRSPTNPIHVDHIKPRRDFPELALEIENLQVLCDECNHGKGNWDTTDWRNGA